MIEKEKISKVIGGTALAGAVIGGYYYLNQPNITSNCESPEIKGNISQSGEKIYHMPGQQYYKVTEISTSEGEKMFCTEDEAKSAGWRRSKR